MNLSILIFSIFFVFLDVLLRIRWILLHLLYRDDFRLFLWRNENYFRNLNSNILGLCFGNRTKTSVLSHGHSRRKEITKERSTCSTTASAGDETCHSATSAA